MAQVNLKRTALSGLPPLQVGVIIGLNTLPDRPAAAVDPGNHRTISGCQRPPSERWLSRLTIASDRPPGIAIRFGYGYE
jgi:hypothetical protein